VKLTAPSATVPAPAAPPPHPPLGAPLRRFRPPLPARLEFTERRPTYLWTERLQGEISAHSGPWRSSGDWWQPDQAWRRNEWDIALATGGLYRLILIGDAYFIEGSTTECRQCATVNGEGESSKPAPPPAASGPAIFTAQPCACRRAPRMTYVELHARSAFSFLRGASQPEDLAQESARLELPALALLDRDGVYGAPGCTAPPASTACVPGSVRK
jgi:hypothetical protein